VKQHPYNSHVLKAGHYSDYSVMSWEWSLRPNS